VNHFKEIEMARVKEMEDKIILTMSSSYVSHWTVYDALRELYQNSIDRQTEDQGSTMISSVYDYNDNVTLFVGNESTSLDRRTLILGETSKSESNSSIGKFGEGYKLAILVLLREGMKVSVRIPEEEWIFNIEYVEQFNTSMLTLVINDNPGADSTTFMIENLPKKVWNSYSQYNLYLQENYNCIETENCEVLVDDRNRGKIFVGGLYVNDYMGTSLYGYNFSPSVFKLGRDRNIIEGFNANWEASKALVQATIENIDVLNKVAVSKTSDTEHMSNFVNNSDMLVNTMWNNFSAEFPESIPISNSYGENDLAKRYNVASRKIVSVGSRVASILKQSDGYSNLIDSLEEREEDKDPTEVLEEFIDSYRGKMSDELYNLFYEHIMTKAEDWQLKD
jgi:hypothetical protein